MSAEAIAKLKKEIDDNKKNPYVKVIGDFLIGHLEQHPADAERILAADKTIAKSLNAMKEEARKKQHNGMAMLTDAEGFAVVLKYFGIDTKSAGNGTVNDDFDFKLDDFI